VGTLLKGGQAGGQGVVMRRFLFFFFSFADIKHVTSIINLFTSLFREDKVFGED